MRTIIIQGVAAVAVAVTGSSVAATGSPVAAAAALPFRYTVAVEPDLAALEVVARFDRPVTALSARARDAGRFLVHAVDCDDDVALRHRGRRLLLPPSGISCLRYRVDLAAASTADRRNRGLSPANVLVSPAVWLWRPAQTSKVSVRFDLPGAMRVAVPWQRVAGSSDTYRIPRAPGSSTAAALFGEFDYEESDIPGATLRIAVASAGSASQPGQLFDWVRAQASNVTLAYGRFPNPSPSVVVLPAASAPTGDSPVRFGRVVRDGGESVELFVDRGAPVESYYDDWTATHEFSHMMLPYLDSGHRWISEGFAQYYQNVLLARAGQYTEERAWAKLFRGYERGRRSRPELSPNAAARDRRGALMKVYWSGAALALMADVELRTRSGGRESLDTVLARLEQCCLPAAEMWSGPRLFEKLDTFLEEPLFLPLYSRYANARGFPEVRTLLARLGVVVVDGDVRITEEAELAALRRAITAPGLY